MTLDRMTSTLHLPLEVKKRKRNKKLNERKEKRERLNEPTAGAAAAAAATTTTTEQPKKMRTRRRPRAIKKSFPNPTFTRYPRGAIDGKKGRSLPQEKGEREKERKNKT